jgi:transcriptional regulator with XRE-family HTH domain
MLGEYIKKVRLSRGLSQRELGRLANLSGAFISQLESGEAKRPSTESLKSIASALKVPFSEIAAQYSGSIPAKTPAPKTPAEVMRELTNVMPIAVPVIADMHAPGQIQEYLFIPRPQNGHKNFYGVKIIGSCLSPKVEDGDIIIIDKDDVPDIGKTVLCYHNGNDEPQIIKIKKKNDIADCELYGVILWIMKKP